MHTHCQGQFRIDSAPRWGGNRRTHKKPAWTTGRTCTGTPYRPLPELWIEPGTLQINIIPLQLKVHASSLTKKNMLLFFSFTAKTYATLRSNLSQSIVKKCRQLWCLEPNYMCPQQCCQSINDFMFHTLTNVLCVFFVGPRQNYMLWHSNYCDTLKYHQMIFLTMSEDVCCSWAEQFAAFTHTHQSNLRRGSNDSVRAR